MEQGFIIDRLTNSILNTVSGDSFQTEVIRLGKSDLKHIAKNKGWNFKWKEEYDEIKKEVFKLTIVNNSEYYTRSFKYHNRTRPCFYGLIGKCTFQYW